MVYGGKMQSTCNYYIFLIHDVSILNPSCQLVTLKVRKKKQMAQDFPFYFEGTLQYMYIFPYLSFLHSFFW